VTPAAHQRWASPASRLYAGAERLTADSHLYLQPLPPQFAGLLGRCRLRSLQPFVNMQETGT